MADVIFSHQVSLPSMINENDCDTQLPNNIFDDEFHPDIKELPPSRPVTEPTPLSYMLAKSRLCNELGNILQMLNGINKHVSYDEIIRFDARVRQIMRELPPHLKLTSLEGTEDSVTLLLARFNIDNLCQRVLCLLHRKYLPRARHNPRYAHSRRSAVEASVRALNQLDTMHRESEPGGRLQSVSWYIRSVATNDFTMAAILLILDLHYDSMAANEPQQERHEGNFIWPAEQKKEMLDLLEKCRIIWASLESSSMDALKASKVTELMLNMIKNPSNSVDSAFRQMETDGGPGYAMPLAPPAPSPRANYNSASTGGNVTASMTPSAFLPELGNNHNGLQQFSNNEQENGPYMGMDLGISPSHFDMSGAENISGGAGGGGVGGGGPGMMDAMMGGPGPGPASPFSLFNMDNGTGSMPDFTANFDWVSRIALEFGGGGKRGAEPPWPLEGLEGRRNNG